MAALVHQSSPSSIRAPRRGHDDGHRARGLSQGAPGSVRWHGAALGNGDGQLHAAAADAGDVADEVARAGRRERDDGPAAGVVVAERVAPGAGVVGALAHFRHSVVLAPVAEECNGVQSHGVGWVG